MKKNEKPKRVDARQTWGNLNTKRGHCIEMESGKSALAMYI